MGACFAKHRVNLCLRSHVYGDSILSFWRRHVLLFHLLSFALLHLALSASIVLVKYEGYWVFFIHYILSLVCCKRQMSRNVIVINPKTIQAKRIHTTTAVLAVQLCPVSDDKFRSLSLHYLCKLTYSGHFHEIFP